MVLKSQFLITSYSLGRVDGDLVVEGGPRRDWRWLVDSMVEQDVNHGLTKDGWRLSTRKKVAIASEVLYSRLQLHPGTACLDCRTARFSI